MTLQIGKSYKTNIEITFFRCRENAGIEEYKNIELLELWEEVPEKTIFLVIDTDVINDDEQSGTEYTVFWNGKKYYVKYTDPEIDWFLNTKNFEEVI